MHYLRYLNQTSQLNEEVNEHSSIIIGEVELETEPTFKPKSENEPPAETEEAKQLRLQQEEQARQQRETDDANKTGKVVTIDDGTGAKDYILDANGNATLNGEIVFSKEDLDKAENADSNDDLDKDDIHTLISQVSGLELKDKEGNPISFKPGIEGLAEREIYIKDLFYSKGKEEAINSIFENNPDLKQMYSYKQKYGSLEGYANLVDYNKFEITDDTSTEELKTIIKEHLSKLGNDTSYIDRFIKMSESDETLRVDALNSLGKLKEIQTATEQSELEQTKKDEQLAIERYESYYGVTYDKSGKLVDKNIEGSVYDKIVKSGKIGNIFIPKEGLLFTKQDGTKQSMTRTDLFNYFYKPVTEQNGVYYTQAQLDENKRLNNTDNFLIQGIRNATGNDLKSLEKTMQSIIRIKDAKKIITISSKSNTESKDADKSEILKQLKDGSATIVV